MTTWIVVVVVVIAVILLAWGANAYRLARRNRMVGRRSPSVFGRGGPDVDDQNRSVRGQRGDD